MKTLGINIDGVIRDFYNQFDRQYRKVFIHNPSIVGMNEEDMTYKASTEEEDKRLEDIIREKERELITMPIDSANLLNHYKFNSKSIEMSKFIEMKDVDGLNLEAIELTPKQNLDTFINETYAFQLFTQAEEFPGAADIVNRIQFMGLNGGLFKVVLLSTLKSKAIPATFSFLGKINCRVRQIIFLESDAEKWDHCDAIVDVMPETFQTKPDGKTSIKINHLSNQWDGADYSYDSIKGICNEDFFNKIFK